MTPVDLNRLREAMFQNGVSPADRYEVQTATLRAVLDAPTVWWCRVDTKPKGSESPCYTSKFGHDRCGPVNLVPVKGES